MISSGAKSNNSQTSSNVKNSRVGKPSGLRERTKRDFSTAQTDTFAGAKAEEKASVCFGRNDKIAEMPGHQYSTKGI
jgi:hypothetical protein